MINKKFVFLTIQLFTYVLGMGTSSKFQSRVIEGISRGSIEYSFIYYLFLECNAWTALLPTKHVMLILNQNSQLFIVQNTFSLQK